jgi:hypothetical protein
MSRGNSLEKEAISNVGISVVEDAFDFGGLGGWDSRKAFG